MLTPLSPSRIAARAPLRVGFVGAIGRGCFGDLWLRTAPALETAFSTGSRAGLLAALAGAALDVVVHPGAPASEVATALLCHDRLVVLMRAGHPLAGGERVDLAGHPQVLLPAEGDGGDLRRLVRALAPGLPAITELAPSALDRRLREGDEVAVAPAALADELGAAIVGRPLAGAATDFPVRIAWRPAAWETDFRRLLSALAM